MNKQIIVTAAFFGLTAVIFGAFGAHALKAVFSATELENWKTAVSYQFYHTLAILFLSTFPRYRSRSVKAAFFLFAIGIVLFSGSLYLLSARGVLGISASFLGPITPIGGMFLILGWISLMFAALKNR